MRQALGTVVFFGMLGVTFVGLFFTPVFFNVIRRVTGRNVLPPEERHPIIEEPAPAAGHVADAHGRG